MKLKMFSKLSEGFMDAAINFAMSKLSSIDLDEDGRSDIEQFREGALKAKKHVMVLLESLDENKLREGLNLAITAVKLVGQVLELLKKSIDIEKAQPAFDGLKEQGQDVIHYIEDVARQGDNE